MVVLDTHVWLWWANESERMSERARSAIESTESIGISAVSCWEVGLLSTRGRVSLDRELAAWIRQALARPGIVALPLDPEVATEAALLEHEAFPRDPADRMIYATARSRGAVLVTKDQRIRDFDPRGTLW